MLKISEKEQKELGQKYALLAQSMIDSREDWLNTVMRGRQIVAGDGAYIASYYPNTERFHFPIIEEKIDSFYPRVASAFWGTNPVIRCRPLSGGSVEEDAAQNEDFLTWAVHYDIPDFYIQWECWNRNAIQDGVSSIKVLWDETWQRTTEVHRVTREFAEQGPAANGQPITEDTPQESRVKTDEDILDEIFTLKNILDVEVLSDEDGDERKYKLTIRENHRRIDDVRVEIGEDERDDLWQVRVRRLVLKKASPIVGVCEPEDLLVNYRSTGPQDSQTTIHQTWYTVAQLKVKRAREGWALTDKDIRYLELAAQWKPEELDNNTEFKEMKDEFSGENPMKESSYRQGKFLVLECYDRVELEDDGYESEVVYFQIVGLQKVVKGYFLEEVLPHGQRPFPTLYYKPNSDRHYCTGMAAQLMAINMQVNVTFNQINENQAFTNRPYFFYVPSALQTDLDVMENIKPGQGIPINDAAGLIFPQWPQTPLADMQLFSSVMMMGDRLGGISPLMSGSTQMKNAPRTARGTNAIISEGNVRMDGFIERAQKTGWKDVLWQIHSLYAFYGDDEKWFWVIKAPKKRKKVSARQMRTNMEWYFEGNTVNTNPEVMRTIAQVRYQILAAEPLYQSDPGARQELIRGVIKAFPEGIDTERAIPQLPGQGGTHPPLAQEQENMMMFQGQWVDVLPGDDHLDHLAAIQNLKKSSIFGDWTEASIAMLGAHYNQHAQALAGAAQQQGPGTGAGLANNVSQNETATGEVGQL